MPLTASDFPLMACGPQIYTRDGRWLLTTTNEALASDLVMRLNRDEYVTWTSGKSSGELVYG